jgi:signal transduction histidine kinase
LIQVLDGLVSNAIKFSRPGGQITLGTGLSDAKAPLLLVRDTGLGINPQQIAHLFDPSGPKGEPVVHLPANEAPDLHTIHEILSACDGKIRVESEPGQGTVFSVSLPTPREPPKP